MLIIHAYRLQILSHQIDEMNESRQEMANRLNELNGKLDRLLFSMTIEKKSATTTHEISSKLDKQIVNSLAKPSAIERTTSAIGDLEMSPRMIPLKAVPSQTSESTTLICKTVVPDNKKSWDVKFDDYKPPIYTSAQVLSAEFADTDLLSMWVKLKFSYLRLLRYSIFVAIRKALL